MVIASTCGAFVLLMALTLGGFIISREAEDESKEPSVSTILTSFGNSFDPYGALSTPIYQTTNFKQPTPMEAGPYDYTRGGDPTRTVLERLLVKLDKADSAHCFTSGMAALAVVTHLVGPGQEIVAGADIYGGSDRLLSHIIPGKGIGVKRVDMTDLDEVASAIGPLTKLVWLESPTNPLQQISDIRKISELAHAHGALLLVNNSIMSPILSQPLELGADIVVHSATKFIAGHSDVMAGVVALKDPSIGKELAFLQFTAGSGLAPFDVWICLRGIKTMALRVEKQQENAQKIAEFVSSHPRVKEVNYAGLPDHPGRSLHYSQAKGAGSVLSFSTGSVALSEHICVATKYFSIAQSFGSVRSYISMPCFMSHACIPAPFRKSRGLTYDTVSIQGSQRQVPVSELVGKTSYCTSQRMAEIEAETEELAKGWPEKVKHPLHKEHELVLSCRKNYGCDGWSYLCKEYNFDLHPKCAFNGAKDGKVSEDVPAEDSKKEWVCDGEVCYKA